MIYSRFDHKKNILITTFEGDIYLEDVLKYINDNRLNKEYPRELKILTDSTKSNMIIDMENIDSILQQIVDANKETLKEYDSICDAFVLESSYDTALTYLYQQLSETKKYYFKIFSTFDAAKKWHHLSC